MNRACLLLAPLVAMAFTAAAQSTGARAGKWEIVKTIESSDAQANGRKVTVTRCFTEADVASVERLVPSQRETDETCKVRDVRAKGSEVTWKSTCEMPGATRTGSGRMNLQAERFEAVAQVDGKVGGRSVRSSHTVVGQRVGDCR